MESAILSVIDQDYEPKEIILIDGGSQDQSLEIINAHKKQIKYWVSEPDRGQAHAINKGFLQAEGDIITFLSSDDIYLPNAFSCVAELWQNHLNCGAIIGGFRHMNESSDLSLSVVIPRLPYQTPIDLSLIPPENWRLHQVSTFYSRKALDQIGRHVREDLRYVMDRELLFRVAKIFEIVLDDRPYAAFRRHAESKSISSFLPFSEEFGSLYLESPSTNTKDQRVRERTARYYHAKGYLHLAKYCPDFVDSHRAFAKAVKIYPEYLFTRNFWVAWCRRVLKLIKRND